MVAHNSNRNPQIDISRALGIRLAEWYSSIGSSIYDVSARAKYGMSVDEKTVRLALEDMKSGIGIPCLSGRQQEIAEIISEIESVLGEPYSRDDVTNAVARVFWANAWLDMLDGADYNGIEKMSAGGTATNDAPETGMEMVAFASVTVSNFERRNKKTVNEILSSDKNLPNAYEYGGRLANSLLGFPFSGIGADCKLPELGYREEIGKIFKRARGTLKTDKKMDKIPTAEELLSMDQRERKQLQAYNFTDGFEGYGEIVGCFNCTSCPDCSDCSNCKRCSNCTDCTHCMRCTHCRDCWECRDCSDCHSCTDCAGCYNCRYCIGIKGGTRLWYVAYGRQLTKEQWEDLLKL